MSEAPSLGAMESMPSNLPSMSPTAVNNGQSNSDSSSSSGLSSGGAAAIGVTMALVVIGVIALVYVKWYVPRQRQTIEKAFSSTIKRDDDDVFSALAPQSSNSRNPDFFLGSHSSSARRDSL
jgi:hypothetical protein